MSVCFLSLVIWSLIQQLPVLLPFLFCYFKEKRGKTDVAGVSSVMYKTIFVINIIIYMCSQHSNVL